VPVDEQQEPEEESPDERPVPTPLFKNRRSKRKRTTGGSFLVIAAAIIILFLLAGSWYFMNWLEQQPEIPAADTTTQQQDAPPPSASGPVADEEPETTPHTVESGETLWGIANNNYENPYLWPWIYDTNQAAISNPDIIEVGQVLDIPEPEEPTYGLTKNDSLQVAIGYVETYRWYKGNNLDEAKYYLYVAKKYNSDVLQHTDVEVDEADLAFANQAE
jgi:LysM repeat protein